MNTYSDWKDKASWLTIRNQAFIDGEFVNSLSGKTFGNINPATAQKIVNVSECDKADVDYAVTVARRAFDDGRWSNMHPAERGKRLMRLADLITANADELALLETLDMGKPISEATGIDIPNSMHHAIDIYRRRCIKFRSKIILGGFTSISINNCDRCLLRWTITRKSKKINYGNKFNRSRLWLWTNG